jgi:hypothetical protein
LIQTTGQGRPAPQRRRLPHARGGRGVRPLEIQQKVSGCPASGDIAQNRLDIRSYIGTVGKHGKHGKKAGNSHPSVAYRVARLLVSPGQAA